MQVLAEPRRLLRSAAPEDIGYQYRGGICEAFNAMPIRYACYATKFSGQIHSNTRSLCDPSRSLLFDLKH